MTTIKKIDKFNQEDYIEVEDGKEIISLPRGSFEISCGSKCEIYCLDECEISCGSKCEIYCLDECEINCRNECEISCGRKCEIYCDDKCKIFCENECEITASKGTKVTGWFGEKKLNYTFEKRKKIKFTDGKFWRKENENNN